MNEQVPWSDPHILLSWLNMKLRDECSHLEILCEKFEIDPLAIKKRMDSIGYRYEEKTNQFIAQEI